MPEFNSRKDIEKWLKTREREEIVLFAARAALRVLPLVATDQRDKMPAALLLPCLRATSASWLAGTWPSQGAEVRDAARAAAHATDAAALENGMSVLELSAMPLWPGGKLPDGSAELWGDLKSRLPEGENWDVWTDWYEARLRGAPANMELEKARVLIPDEDWKQGPAHVNAIIKRLIEEHSPKLPALLDEVRTRATQEIAERPAEFAERTREEIALIDDQIAELQRTMPNEEEQQRRALETEARLKSIRSKLAASLSTVENLPKERLPVAVEAAADNIAEATDEAAALARSTDEEASEAETTVVTWVLAAFVTFLMWIKVPMAFADILLGPFPGSAKVIERLKELDQKK
ncbi:MAG: hypothetical protein AAGE80_00920 [Pseudomonadota bacterium]